MRNHTRTERQGQHQRYGLIYVDPPWRFIDQANSGKRGACHKYPVLSVTELSRLPVGDLAHPDGCLLALWWVASQPAEALRLVEAWGFTIKHMMGLVWVKRTTHGRPAFGMGHFTRAGAEACLLATRGRVVRVSASVRQVIEAPLGPHSQKPIEARDRLVALVGEDVPRIELFARTRVPGWHAWGNEIDSDVNLALEPLRSAV